ncbi:amino acid ABC transporter permease [Pseudomonas sp. WHRI 8519]|uniref:amino acid ABC transporter permease n=1 Tax=Pseudomonas sp. WHRI 8519 TaxID=3162567 RepID=UPI0032EE0FCA
MYDFDFQVIINSLPYLMTGLSFTLQLTAVAFLGGLALGLVLAMVRHLNVPVLAQIATIYVAVMRSIPLILVLFWLFFMMPLILQLISPDGRPIPLGPTNTAFITFTLFEAAYFAEIIRTGLRSIPKGQYEASEALALTKFQMYRKVIIPQVLVTTTPIMLTQAVILFQDTSLVYVLSLTDLLGAASKVAQRDSRLLEMYVTVAVIYFVISSVAVELVNYMEKRRKRRSGLRGTPTTGSNASTTKNAKTI